MHASLDYLGTIARYNRYSVLQRLLTFTVINRPFADEARDYIFAEIKHNWLRRNRSQKLDCFDQWHYYSIQWHSRTLPIMNWLFGALGGSDLGVS